MTEISPALRGELEQAARDLQQLSEALTARQEAYEQRPEPPNTGIRRNNRGEWVAIRAGRYRGSWSGPGSKRLAIEAAGTNRVIA
jgi:hypothetical protein